VPPRGAPGGGTARGLRPRGARSVRQPADEAAGLVRVVRLAVPPDGGHVARLEHQGHAASPASRRRSLRYRSPESGAMTTTTAVEGGRGRSRAVNTRSAATRAAPRAPPT